jgi:hypothetical protein
MDVLQSTQKMGVLGFHFISMLEKVVAFVATCTDSRIAKALIKHQKLPIIISCQVQSLVLAGEGPLDCR